MLFSIKKLCIVITTSLVTQNIKRHSISHGTMSQYIDVCFRRSPFPFLSAYLLCRLISSLIQGTHGRIVIFHYRSVTVALRCVPCWIGDPARNAMYCRIRQQAYQDHHYSFGKFAFTNFIRKCILINWSQLPKWDTVVFNLNSSARWAENKMSGACRSLIRLSDFWVITRSSVWPSSCVGSATCWVKDIDSNKSKNDKQLNHCDHQHGC